MEVAKNPTDKNISMWFKYLEIKNKLATRLQSRMAEYLAKKPGVKIPEATKRGLEIKRKSIAKVDAKRFRVRMYFESTCPHCKKMMTTLKSLQEQGYFVVYPAVIARFAVESRTLLVAPVRDPNWLRLVEEAAVVASWGCMQGVAAAEEVEVVAS